MTKQLAPIVLFAYNRPWHMLQVLNALAKNVLAKESILYIYCDGQKPEATREEVLQIEKVKEIAKSEDRFKEVIAIEQQVNKGLANSIIHGVTEIINKHGKVIVLEDDILPSIGFLKYMNDALALYEKEEKVGCIHAWNYNLNYSDYAQSTFFLKGADCWGWATWKRAWDLFNPDSKMLLKNIEAANAQFDFDRRGTYKFTDMLLDQSNGKVDSWAIRWHASLFLQGKYCLQPTRTIVKNIGLDNSGVHCGISDMNQNPVQYIQVHKMNDIQESEWFYREYNNLLSLENKSGTRILHRFKTVIKKVFTRKSY